LDSSSAAFTVRLIGSPRIAAIRDFTNKKAGGNFLPPANWHFFQVISGGITMIVHDQTIRIHPGFVKFTVKNGCNQN